MLCLRQLAPILCLEPLLESKCTSRFLVPFLRPQTSVPGHCPLPLPPALRDPLLLSFSSCTGSLLLSLASPARFASVGLWAWHFIVASLAPLTRVLKAWFLTLSHPTVYCPQKLEWWASLEKSVLSPHSRTGSFIRALCLPSIHPVLIVSPVPLHCISVAGGRWHWSHTACAGDIYVLETHLRFSPSNFYMVTLQGWAMTCTTLTLIQYPEHCHKLSTEKNIEWKRTKLVICLL